MKSLPSILLVAFLTGCPSAEEQGSTADSAAADSGADGEGDSGETLQAEDCLASWGSNCGCTPLCLTQEYIDAITDSCDVDCGATTWSCGVDGDACVVAPE